jgi:hypothetical protein
VGHNSLVQHLPIFVLWGLFSISFILLSIVLGPDRATLSRFVKWLRFIGFFSACLFVMTYCFSNYRELFVIVYGGVVLVPLFKSLRNGKSKGGTT